jgi:hypothetical protein
MTTTGHAARMGGVLAGLLLLLSPALAQAQDPGGAAATKQFLRDLARDYRNYLSIENLEITTVGLTAAASIHVADEKLAGDTAYVSTAVTAPGATYGIRRFNFRWPSRGGSWAAQRAALAPPTPGATWCARRSAP